MINSFPLILFKCFYVKKKFAHADEQTMAVIAKHKSQPASAHCKTKVFKIVTVVHMRNQHI